MADLRRRLERLEREVATDEGRPMMHVVEAPDGGDMKARAAAALAAAGVARGPADTLVVIRRCGDSGSPARVVGSHHLGRR